MPVSRLTYEHFIVGTAGHVDHGKSALIKTLTGIDPDRLPEEKARGITIDLGFAHLELPSPASADSSFQLGIVDVPGHEDFVKNMVAGVSSLDVALLVVAADDGWMPQTEEHLQILTYLGVARAVVALTKIDLAQDEGSTVEAIRERLRETRFAHAPIVPTSVVSGRGLDELKTTLAHVLAGTRPSRDIGKPRLPVDRIFTLPGIGTVVTGTLVDGGLRRGQTVVIQPSGKTARIRSLQSHGHDVETGGPGTRTALNLTDIRLEDIHRGNVVTLQTLGGPSEILDVLLEISPRAARGVKHGARVHAHYGSGSVAARVALYSGDELAVGGRALAQLRLDASAFVFAGDRFTVRDWAEQHTLAGGIVLDADASRHGFRSAKRYRCLARRAQSPADVAEFASSQIERDVGVRRSVLLLKSRFSAADVADAEARLVAAGQIVGAGDFVVDAGQWRTVRAKAAEAIDVYHAAHPEHVGLSLTGLRTALGADLPIEQALEALIGDLCRSDFTRVGKAVRRTAHRPALPAALQAAGETLRATLAAHPFDPPSRKDLTPDAAAERALRFLIESGEAVEISSEVVVSADNFTRAVDAVRAYLREHGPATMSDVRQMLGGSRRVVVPLLERLDRDGVTLRSGATRSLR